MPPTTAAACLDGCPGERLSGLGGLSSLLLATMYALLLSSPALPQPVPPASSMQVRGEVLMWTSELVVVKQTDGTSVLFNMGKDAIVDASLKVGDRVEVRFTSDQHVISVRKLTTETEPIKEGSSP